MARIMAVMMHVPDPPSTRQLCQAALVITALGSPEEEEGEVTSTETHAIRPHPDPIAHLVTLTSCCSSSSGACTSRFADLSPTFNCMQEEAWRRLACVGEKCGIK